MHDLAPGRRFFLVLSDYALNDAAGGAGSILPRPCRLCQARAGGGNGRSFVCSSNDPCDGQSIDWMVLPSPKEVMPSSWKWCCSKVLIGCLWQLCPHGAHIYCYSVGVFGRRRGCDCTLRAAARAGATSIACARWPVRHFAVYRTPHSHSVGSHACFCS